MKSILFILLFISLSHSLSASGFSDWSHTTDNGTNISQPGGGIILYTKHTNEMLEHLNRWYFYKDHIIGEYEIFKNPEWKTAYFIVNESDGKIRTYDNKDVFEKQVKEYELVLKLWTRWYYDHYTILQFIVVLFILSTPIMAVIFLFLSLFIFLSITLKNKLLKIIFIIITLILILPLTLFMLHDYITISI